MSIVARLRSGVTPEQADLDLANVSARVNQQYGVINSEFVGKTRSLKDEFAAEDVTLITSTMMGALTFVLLIARANVANLMLARAAGRQREIAVRTAIGASRMRIVRQMLTEAIILAGIAGALAVPLSWEGIRLIQMAIPAENPMPYYMHFSVDRTTLIYTIGVSLRTGIAFGLVPALQSSTGRRHGARVVYCDWNRT